MKEQVIHNQPSFLLANEQVSVAITERGGHMAPVIFRGSDGQQITPYYISPWQDEEHEKMPADVLVPLRGDFCMPFGKFFAHNGEEHPALVKRLPRCGLLSMIKVPSLDYHDCNPT